MCDEFLERFDLGFFAYFSDGKLAHFATAGQGDVPDKFRNSLQDWEVVYDFVHALGANYGFDVVEKNVPACKTEAQRESYLKSFASMASKGFFSYNFIGGAYRLIAMPRVGKVVAELPVEIRLAMEALTIASGDDVRVIGGSLLFN